MKHSVSKNTTERLQVLHHVLETKGIRAHLAASTPVRVGAETRSLSDVFSDYGEEAYGLWTPEECLAADIAAGIVELGV